MQNLRNFFVISFHMSNEDVEQALVPSCSRPLLEAAPVARLGASEMSGATVSWWTRRLKTSIPMLPKASHRFPAFPTTLSSLSSVTFISFILLKVSLSSHIITLQINARKVPPETPFSNVELLHCSIRLVLLRHALSLSTC